MLNLLLKKDKDFIRKEYFLRFFNILLIFLFFSIFSGLVMILPPYQIVRFQEEVLEQQIKNLTNTVSASKHDELQRASKQVSQHFGLLNKNTPNYSPIISLLENNAPTGVKIESINFQIVEPERGNQKSHFAIELKGVAKRRDLLVLFTNNLRDEETFEDINLPLSNLTKETDVQFNLTLVTKNINF